MNILLKTNIIKGLEKFNEMYLSFFTYILWMEIRKHSINKSKFYNIFYLLMYIFSFLETYLIIKYLFL